MEGITKINPEIDLAVQHLTVGDVIAYPTESVFGLGCDPFNMSAVTTLLQLKKRSLGKGFILVASDFSQVEHLTQPINPRALAQVESTWPGPVTWIFPCTEEAPKWITGDNNSIALRISNHPVIRDLCNAFNGPIVSTSANEKGCLPARSRATLEMLFGKDIAMTVSGDLGKQLKPTTIRDAITGEVIRA